MKKRVMRKEKFRKFLLMGKASIVFYEIALRSANMRNEKKIVFFSSKSNRQEICDKMGISDPSFMKHLAYLVSEKVMIRDGAGHYELDYELADELVDLTK